MKVAIVTGASSGIGKETAICLVAQKVKVYGISRRAEAADGVVPVCADLTDGEAVSAAVREIFAREGHIDIVVNNAGAGISGAVEFTDTEAARKLFDINFFGGVRVNAAVIPLMREAGGGRIVNISSVAAPVAIPFQAYYSATKAAVNAYSSALRGEVKPFGISVTAVMPGDIASGFTAAREKTAAGDDIYGGRITRSVAGMEKDERNGMSPHTAGKYIAGIALKKHVKPFYAVGIAYKAVVVLAKLLPAGLTGFIVGKLYAK